MFYSSEDINKQNQYKQYLQIVGSLSNLFSDSSIPYLYYRIAEKMFCNAFDTQDLSRGDVSYDAKKGSLGIGLKTFLRKNDKSIQKIAEFNQDLPLYQDLTSTKKIHKIAELRNKRIEFTNNTYDITNAIYHCVIRDQGKFYLYEEDTKKIDIPSIRNIKTKKSSIYFDDGNYEYIFSLSKSTLMKRFETNFFVDEFDVEILKNPLEDLFNCFDKNLHTTMFGSQIIDTVYLPLYGSSKKVYSNSGLNQWNASGRQRNPDEIYIPIPKRFYNLKPNFFPNRDVDFSLKLPNNEIISAKVCQENSKALMSNPNKKLGRWLLRDVFNLNEGTLVSNELLNVYGIDSVRIDKISESEYEINFAKTNSFENFISSFE